MAWYAYCVSEKQTFPELLRHRKPVPLAHAHGIQGNQVFLYPAGDFAVLVSPYSPYNKEEAARCARAHFRVVADCFEQAAVLPFRFGTVFASDEALRRTLRSNSRSFAQNLSYLSGKLEMCIRLTLDDCCSQHWTAAQPGEGSVGREYLSSLRESATRSRERSTLARTIAMQMNRMFAPVAEEVSCKLEGGKMQLVLSHLIERRGLERYVNKFQSTRTLMSSCEMHLSGPLPPYHFIDTLAASRATVPLVASAPPNPVIAAQAQVASASALLA
jgi:hypothetical protein